MAKKNKASEVSNEGFAIGDLVTLSVGKTPGVEATIVDIDDEKGSAVVEFTKSKAKVSRKLSLLTLAS